MNNIDGGDQSSTRRSSSLLADALDIPSLKQDPTNGGGSNGNNGGKKYNAGLSTESVSTYPSTVVPSSEDSSDCEGGTNDDDDDCDNGMLKNSPSLETSAITRTMSGFDTPVIANNSKSVALNLGYTKPNGNGVLRERPPTNNASNTSPYHGTGIVRNDSFVRDDDEVPRHSDFTVPTSHTRNSNKNVDGTEEPPMTIQPPSLRMAAATGTNKNESTTTAVRSILGTSVGKKYHCAETDRRPIRIPMAPMLNSNYGSIQPPLEMVTTPSANPTVMTPLSSESASLQQQQQFGNDSVQAEDPQYPSEGHSAPAATSLHNEHHQRSSSRMIPRVLPTKQYASTDYDDYYDETNDDIIDKQPQQNEGLGTNGSFGGDQELLNLLPDNSFDQGVCTSARDDNLHKSVRKQSLLVGLAFMVIWLPNNAMAPNLTQMAEFFGMNEAERDLYLGSYCALALGVFSIPLSGVIGFMADFYSRKHLFVGCCLFGAFSAAWSGWSANYVSLFIARLCTGGCMSGSVPVAFSLMGDLFSKEERNAASSGLTSMMGLGILLGQVYAGEIGPTKSWQYPFFASALVQLTMAVTIALWVEEPIRGGKEQALQGVFKSGNKYERQLTMEGFIDAMRKNASNGILLWYGFLTSIPWGIVFVFLNDYLSQEKGFSVEQATFLVMLFGVGCAIGGITGGYLGQLFMRGNRSFLPLYMAASTFLGIFPFAFLLNSEFPHHNGWEAKFLAVLGGCIASLPSVNVRPCILNVNPPESRGAALTTANLFVALGRGIGPSCIVLLGSIFQASRQASFNITLSVFWTISGVQLLFLARTLPRDQDAMEEDLARYAAASNGGNTDGNGADEEQGGDNSLPLSPIKTKDVWGDSYQQQPPMTPNHMGSVRVGDYDEEDDLYNTIISSPPAQYMTIDGNSLGESFRFVKLGIQEFGEEITHRNAHCRGCDTISPCESNEDVRQGMGRSLGQAAETNGSYAAGNASVDSTSSMTDEFSREEMRRRREMWIRRQKQQQQQD